MNELDTSTRFTRSDRPGWAEGGFTEPLNLRSDGGSRLVGAGEHRRALGRWPLAGIGAAALGAVGSFVLGFDPDESVTREGTGAIVAATGDHRQTIMIGASLGFLSVLALLVFAAGFTRLAGRRAPASLAVPAMRLAFGGAVGSLIFSFGLKHALAGGAPGGIDASFYTKTDVEVLTLIVSQMQYAAWWGVIAAAGCAAVLALRLHVFPTWFGVVSALLATVSIGATLLVGLPYSAGLLAPVWLVAASIAVLRLRDREV